MRQNLLVFVPQEGKACALTEPYYKVRYKIKQSFSLFCSVHKIILSLLVSYLISGSVGSQVWLAGSFVRDGLPSGPGSEESRSSTLVPSGQLS